MTSSASERTSPTEDLHADEDGRPPADSARSSGAASGARTDDSAGAGPKTLGMLQFESMMNATHTELLKRNNLKDVASVEQAAAQCSLNDEERLAVETYTQALRRSRNGGSAENPRKPPTLATINANRAARRLKEATKESRADEDYKDAHKTSIDFLLGPETAKLLQAYKKGGGTSNLTAYFAPLGPGGNGEGYKTSLHDHRGWQINEEGKAVVPSAFDCDALPCTTEGYEEVLRQATLEAERAEH